MYADAAFGEPSISSGASCTVVPSEAPVNFSDTPVPFSQPPFSFVQFSQISPPVPPQPPSVDFDFTITVTRDGHQLFHDDYFTEHMEHDEEIVIELPPSPHPLENLAVATCAATVMATALERQPPFKQLVASEFGLPPGHYGHVGKELSWRPLDVPNGEPLVFPVPFPSPRPRSFTFVEG